MQFAYADNLAFKTCCKSTKNNLIQIVKNWATVNKMKLNLAKSEIFKK